VGVAGLGDFEEVVRLQAGIRQWLLRTARNGRHELRGIPAPAVLPLLCAAAFGPALTEAADLGGAAAVARVGVLSSVGASALGDVLAQALDRVRSAQPGGDLPRGDVQPVYAAAFGPGGSTLATADGDGAARIWDVAFPANLLQAACGIANVSLTRQQWADYAGTQPFQQVCPAG
jgi:hypothetical protein